MLNKLSKTDHHGAEGNRGWSDLHEDILLLIKGKLKIVDQLCFRGVCRSWRSVSHQKSADKLPWILVFHRVWESGKCGLIADILYDPSNSKEYTLAHQLISPDSTINTFMYYSNFGWLFLASTRFSSDCKLSLHHVFTRTAIDLPALKAIEYGLCSKVTFSTHPTRSDCVFCAAHYVSISPDRIIISIYRNGDAAWRSFNLENPNFSEVHNVFCNKGRFYFVFDKGLLWTFNIVSHHWQQLPVDNSQIVNLQSEFRGQGKPYKMKMIESNGDGDGEILLVYYCREWKPWYIFKLDWSLMAWVKEATLGNRALFLGESSISIPTSGEIKSSAGHIHFRNTCRFHHYCFKNNGRHRISKLRGLVNKYYSCFKKVENDYSYWVWVEPYY